MILPPACPSVYLHFQRIPVTQDLFNISSQILDTSTQYWSGTYHDSEIFDMFISGVVELELESTDGDWDFFPMVNEKNIQYASENFGHKFAWGWSGAFSWLGNLGIFILSFPQKHVGDLVNGRPSLYWE